MAISLGEVSFGLGADTRALNASMATLREFGRAVDFAEAKVKQLRQRDGTGLGQAVEAEAALRRQERAMTGMISRTLAFNRVVRDSNMAEDVRADLIKDSNAQLAKAIDLISNKGRAMSRLELQRGIESWKASTDHLTRSFKDLDSAASASGKTQAQYENFLNRVKSSSDRAHSSITRFNQSVMQSGIGRNQQADITGRASAALNTFQTTVAAPNITKGGYDTALRNFRTQLEGLRNEFSNAKFQFRVQGLSEAATLAEKLQHGFRGLGAAATIATGPLSGISARFTAFNNLSNNVGLSVGLLAGSLLVLGTGFYVLGKSMISTVMNMQAVEKTLTAVTGSASVAATQLQFIRETSDKAGLSFQNVSRDFGKFYAAATAAGVKTQEIQRIFEGMSMVAGTLQLSVEDTSGVFKALEQMLSKGTVQAEELRGQLGDRLVGAFQIAARAMNMTTVELNDMMKKGQVFSQEFVSKFVDAAAKMYNIDMSKSIDTLQASLNRTGNAWTFFQLELDKAMGASESFKGAVEVVGNALVWMTNNVDTLIGSIGGLASGFIYLYAVMNRAAIWSAMQSAIGALVTGFLAFSSNIVLVTRSLWLAVTAQEALNIAMLANPIVAVGKALLWLAGLVATVVAGYSLFESTVTDTGEAFHDNLQHVNAWIEAQGQLSTATNEAVVSMINQQRAMQSILDFQNIIAKTAHEITGQRVERLKGVVANPALGTSAEGQAFNAAALREAEAAYADQKIQIQKNNDAINVLGANILAAENALRSNIATTKAFGGASTEYNRASDKIEELAANLDLAHRQMQVLGEGKEAVALAKDFWEADQILKGMNKEQLTELGKKLEGLGYKGNNTRVQLARLISVQRSASDSVTAWAQNSRKAAKSAQEEANAYANASGKITELVNRYEDLNKQMQVIQGGGSFSDVMHIQRLIKARDVIDGLSNESLGKLSAAMAAVGVTGTNTADQIATMFARLDEADSIVNEFLSKHDPNKQRQVLNEATKEIDDALLGVKEIEKLIAAYQNGGAGSGQAMERALTRAAAVREMVEKLDETGVSWQVIQQKASQYLNVLTQIDAANVVLERTRQAAEEARQAWEDWGTTAIDQIGDVLKGSQSLGDALKNIWRSLGNMAIDSLVLNPMKQWWQQLMTPPEHNNTGAGPSGIWGVASQGLDWLTGRKKDDPLKGGADAVSLFTDNITKASAQVGGGWINSIVSSALQMATKTTVDATATSAMATLASSAYAAALALQQVAANGGGGSNGGGIFGFLKNITGIFGGMKGGFIKGMGGGAQGSTFLNGGYTGNGSKFEVAGLVHRKELVWTERDIANVGGLQRAETLRRNARKLGRTPQLIRGPQFINPLVAGRIFNTTETRRMLTDMSRSNILRSATLRTAVPRFKLYEKGGFPGVGTLGVAGGGDELWVPTASGRNRPGLGNGGGTYIDARTTIDARGATTDAIAELKASMAARDRQLRTELPGLVDTRVQISSNRGRIKRVG